MWSVELGVWSVECGVMVSLRDKFNNFLIIAAGDTIIPNS